MTQQSATVEQPTSSTRRRKPFPVMNFEEVLAIARTIHEDGVGDQLRRLTLFDRLGKSPDSGPSRQMITTSSRYGLTSGGYKAEHLALTEHGRAISSRPLGSVRKQVFQCAIARIDIFGQLYDKLKSLRLPAGDVLQDELRQLGLDPADSAAAAEVFIANARYVGLIREVSGSERILPIEQVLEETKDALGTHDVTQAAISVDEEKEQETAVTPAGSTALSEPSVHIDVQVHIDSTATPEQIDKIFASMARHLYRREG